MTTDPFGTERLRASVLAAWRDSPTRFTEDTNAEYDLRVGGYRDRLFVELVQNAADAAALAGEPGTLRVSLKNGELRAANTGAALDAPGVASLASLRASAKDERAVGRFGVGFAAVLAVTAAPRIVSRTGGVAFSAARTREEAARAGDVPVLRLPWPVGEDEPPVPDGFDTEVRLPLDTGADALLDALAAEAADLLLALPWLARIEVGESVWTRATAGDVVELRGPDGTVRRWLTHAGWALRVDEDGRPEPLDTDVLHAPTPTDERLSLPARLMLSIPLEPSRRRVLPGTGARAALGAAAGDYLGLAGKVGAGHRAALVPRAGFPLSEVDGELRELVTRRLADEPWLPSSRGEVPGSAARVLTVDSPELVRLVAEFVPRLLDAPLCGHAAATALAPAGVAPIGAADVVEALTGADKPPSWWHGLYDVLKPLLESHAIAAEDLGAIPVPLADGRTLPGPRGTLLFGELLSEVDSIGLRVVHPEAVHPLLERLGAKRAEAPDLLDAPELRDAVERSAEDALSGLDTRPLASVVIRLLGMAPGAAGEWLSALALPCSHGWRRAGELVLPSSPLLAVFDGEVFEEDGPLAVLDADFADGCPVDVLTALGVLDTFAVVADDDPAAPDHDLPDEESWWDSRAKPPSRLYALRDLDLVADNAWPAALSLIEGRPETHRALHEPGGHTGWWLARYALLDGHPPVEWRLPEASAELGGLYDEVPDLGLSPALLAAVGVKARLGVADLDDAADLLERLGDPARTVPAGLLLSAHAALVDADLDLTELDAPDTVRVLDGSVADADAVTVLDAPWLLAVRSPATLAAAAEPHVRAARLAEILDLPLASESQPAVSGDGEYAPWAELPAVRIAAGLLGVALPDGGVLVHDELLAGGRGVRWWHDGRLHAEDSPEGLARAFAWAADRWDDRFALAALIEDAEPATWLG
ncbi:sacsin N-terminal ATP-binding-like domain-containing protein [Amycolatopsis minnesotensis]|uniref:Molecular chaperone Hsp90 n=1 Tax=Amycolatopsis minnesotensis TaxID=337894 RepID=A0ABP5E8L6_9PSEU